tara:strand:+ start:2996 stop:3679 length:684 start_codon:yes stop_codon:yes gene_type:complete
MYFLILFLIHFPSFANEKKVVVQKILKILNASNINGKMLNEIDRVSLFHKLNKDDKNEVNNLKRTYFLSHNFINFISQKMKLNALQSIYYELKKNIVLKEIFQFEINIFDKKQVRSRQIWIAKKYLQEKLLVPKIKIIQDYLKNQNKIWQYKLEMIEGGHFFINDKLKKRMNHQTIYSYLYLMRKFNLNKIKKTITLLNKKQNQIFLNLNKDYMRRFYNQVLMILKK